MGVLNAPRRFRQAARETDAMVKHPRSVREAFNIVEVDEDGIFVVQKSRKGTIYDRCYVFSDVNYFNKDLGQKKTLLEDMMRMLNSMTVHFKITMANEYRDVHAYIKDLTRDRHRQEYDMIGQGVDTWIDEKLKNGEVQDLNRVMYLTVTKDVRDRDTAKSFFYILDGQLERLFQGMGSVIRPLDGKERLETLRMFFHPEETECPVKYDFKNVLKDPMNTVLPALVEQEKNMMVLGERYAAVMFAREYAPSIEADEVLHSFSAVPFISMLTLDYAPVDKRLLMEMLQAVYMNNEKAIAQEEDAKRGRGQISLGVSFYKAMKRDDIEEYTLQAGNNNESCFLVCFLFVVTADSEEDLLHRVDLIKGIGREKGIYMENCNYTQLKSLNTALPNGCRNVCYPRSFFTSSVVALQPFYAQELQEEGGIFYGLNRTTRHLVFGNRKSLASPHGIIIGHTGSGKSFFLKETEVSQTLLATDDDLIILDPQNEMQQICDEFKGQFLELTPKSQIHINPIEIPIKVFKEKSQSVRSQFILDQIAWLRTFCEAAMRNVLLTEEHYGVLGRALREVYEEVLSQKTLKKQPTLKDLREKIMGYVESAASPEDAAISRKLYNSLEEYTEGVFDLFAHPSNVDTRKRFVVFGLANVPQDLWEPVMVTIMHFLAKRMSYNKTYRRPTRMIIDEAQEVCKNKASAEMLLKSVVTYRKFGGMVTLVLQNLTRAIENNDLRDMLSNCGYKYFLNQGGVDANELMAIQELSQSEFESLHEERPGYGLLVWGKKVIKLDSVMDRENPLYEKFSTNFHEKNKTALFFKSEEEGEKEQTFVIADKELDRAIIKMAKAIPSSIRDMSIVLDRDIEEIAAHMEALADRGELLKKEEAGEIKYTAVEDDQRFIKNNK